MRPRLKAAENESPYGPTRLDGEASMRPRLKAAENVRAEAGLAPKPTALQ